MQTWAGSGASNSIGGRMGHAGTLQWLIGLAGALELDPQDPSSVVSSTHLSNVSIQLLRPGSTCRRRSVFKRLEVFPLDFERRLALVQGDSV